MFDFLTPDHIKAITEGGIVSVVMVVYAISVGGLSAAFFRHLGETRKDFREQLAAAQKEYREDLETVVKGFESALSVLKDSDLRLVIAIDALEKHQTKMMEQMAKLEKLHDVMIAERMSRGKGG